MEQYLTTILPTYTCTVAMGAELDSHRQHRSIHMLIDSKVMQKELLLRHFQRILYATATGGGWGSMVAGG